MRSVQFSPDNQKLLTASDDKAVKVFVFDCLTIMTLTSSYDKVVLTYLFDAIGLGRGENEVHLLNDRAHKLGEVRKVVSRRPPHSLLQVFEKKYYLKKTVLRIAWLYKHRKTLHCMQHTELQRSSIASKSRSAMTEL